MIQYSFYPTDTRLSEYLFSYGMIEVPKGNTVPLMSPPNGLTGFLIRVKSGADARLVATIKNDNPIGHQPSYVIGQITYPINGYATGPLTFMVVFFQPLGMYQLFGGNMNRLANTSMDLFDFLGKEKAAALMKELLAADDASYQVGVLNNFFLQQKVTDSCDNEKRVLDIIHQAKGNITIKEMEESLSISRRTLERYFQEKVGISPKVYAQIFRFKCAIQYLEANPNTKWADLTYDNGFFDQSHMIRYFKEYLQVSPNNLVKVDMALVNYLLRN